MVLQVGADVGQGGEHCCMFFLPKLTLKALAAAAIDCFGVPNMGRLQGCKMILSSLLTWHQG